jgi:hypothetical protein
MDTLASDTGVGSLAALLESCRDEESEDGSSSSRVTVLDTSFLFFSFFWVYVPRFLLAGMLQGEMSANRVQGDEKVTLDNYRLAPEAERFQLPLREIPILASYEGCCWSVGCPVVYVCVRNG